MGGEDKTKDKIKQFTREDGILNDMIHGILEDNFGIIWLSTSKGLVKYNPQNGAFFNVRSLHIGVSEFSDDGCAIVKVEIIDDLLSIAVHSEHPVGFPMVKEIRYKFAPDAYLMSMLMPSRDQQISDNTVVLYQIPGDFSENKTEATEEGE